jgi:hypothetical protein
MLFIASMLCFCALCLAVFGAPVTAGLLLLASIGAGRRRGGGLIALALAMPTALAEYPARIDALSARLQAGGPAALSTRDLTGIWLLNLGMAAGGAAAGFPEVALETALLVVPGGGEREFGGDVAMGAPQVQAAIADYAALAAASGEARVALPPRRLQLDGSGGHASIRAALALNPVTLSGDAVREPDGYRLELVARVPVDYPAGAELTLARVGGWHLRVDEGLYDALEQRGWLFPYTAAWAFTVPVGASGSTRR